MKQPRLGVKSRASRIVRNSDLAAELNKCLDRGCFCRARENRSQDTERPAVLDMPRERLFKWVDACQADEGHDDVDPVCRFDLCLDLVTNARFPGRVSEERRVEQRDQWPKYEFQTPVRKLASDGAQHFGWIHEL